MTPRTAFQGEIMLAGWSETHTGGAKVTFWLPDAESLDVFRSMTVRKGNTAGQRFMSVLVELNDDDTPAVDDPFAKEPASLKGGPLAQSAAMVCDSSAFQEFARTRHEWDAAISPAQNAAEFMRRHCRVNSRSEIDHNPAARASFGVLMSDYRGWQAR